MLPTSSDSIPLFNAFGIRVSIHWSWFLVAAYSIQNRAAEYPSLIWNALEYLALFLIVLLHEFGHALACRQTGGIADKIVLWPLGGVAYVEPPPRPGAYLWSIAAGPLVNVALIPILLTAVSIVATYGGQPNLQELLEVSLAVNIGILIFNLLPIYPLDGGQILRSILWFFIGPIKSLAIAAGIGVVCACAGLIWAISTGSGWRFIMAIFVLITAWQSLRAARRLL